MRFTLTALALLVVAMPSGPAECRPSDEMIDLVPALIAATVSSDLAGPGDVKPVAFAACLRAQGVNAGAMRAAIKRGSPDRGIKRCLDKFIGL